jgi:hypothetical protein
MSCCQKLRLLLYWQIQQMASTDTGHANSQGQGTKRQYPELLDQFWRLFA